jgi:DNA replication ATP-dependent helicase Dna2
MAKPDIAPSVQTKTKLKKFQFVEGEPYDQCAAELNKENYVAVEHDAVPRKQASQTPLKSSSQPDPAERKLPPSTPTSRLPLADLLGNADERKRAIALDITPEEHVLWVHAQTPGSSQPAATPARKRKRAKSSSPASSQQDHLNFFPENRNAFTTEELQNSLNTPQADPAADLWQRYANGTEGPVADKSAAFAHLIRESSPKSPATVGSVGGLRRWASCGIEWPQSETKRRTISRRIEELPQQEEVVAERVSKVSKVGALLERMKETLTKPVLESFEGPSSSSPLPDRITVHEQSPLHRLTPVQEQDEQSPRGQKSRHEPTLKERARKPASSEYSDDDLDTDMLDAMDNTTKAVQPVVRVPQPSAQERQLKVPEDNVHPPTHPARPPVPSTKESAPQFDSDDFDDDDLLAIDLDQIAANYDSQQRDMQSQVVKAEVVSQKASNVPRKQHAGAPQSQPIVQIISDDEFGNDDIDDEQFAAVEAAATQAYQTSGRATGSVCSTIR